MGFRSKDQRRVVEEFKYLAERHGLNTFEVVDNILDMKYFDTMIPALAGEEQGYDIFYETKSNLRRDQLQKMAAAGIRWLQPGIESLDDTVLKLIAKGTTGRQNLQLMKWAQEEGIFVLWILLYDVPGETDDIYLRMAELMPLISHLQPPSGVSFIQFNRFSPYQMRPRDFGIDLSPDRAYSYVYPWDEKAIGDFAYFFDDYSADREQIEMSQHCDLKRPGLAAVRRAFLLWQQEWSGRMHPNPFAVEPPATLVMVERGDELEITDTRRCRVAPRHRLTGLSRAVYEICDQAHNPDGILRRLQAHYEKSCKWDEVAPLVADLCARKLMVEMEGHFLSLAMRGPLRPLPHMRNYPGGRIVSATEARAARLFQHAEEAMSLQMARFM
jgi:magnesium-protoporphyrin IX monomethyl ester (oxidative) cyclase